MESLETLRHEAATRALAEAAERWPALHVDRQRLALLLAVLERRAGLPFGERDVFVMQTPSGGGYGPAGGRTGGRG